MIAVIDYGMGNLRSVQKSLEFVGAKVVVTHDPDLILNADSVVLPGVGSFKDCMSNLKELNLIDPIRKFIDGGKPFLGICLGLQVLFEEKIHMRKSKPVVLIGCIMWALIGIYEAINGGGVNSHFYMKELISEIGELFFFLLVAMTYINT
ncbi:imidazole glycerol phosphate synthase subunit HisH, partial [bacterium]|nr:imidazole glycerol phosphate synthase subunit HisH [bacterium]